LIGGLPWSFYRLRQISSPLEDNCRKNICRTFSICRVLFPLFAGGLCLPCVFSYFCRRLLICQALCQKPSANSM
jgi:hypothetical protein